jgi:uroporphyrinogen decarboxylase
MRGMSNFLLDCHLNPNFAREIMEMVHAYSVEVASALADVGVDVVLYDDDYSESKGPFVSPETWRKLVKPFYCTFVEKFKKRGLFVMLHSDGNVTPLMEDLLEPGIDALNPIEPGAMQLRKVKETYGDRICLVGNVDCGNIMTLGTEEDVRSDVRRCIREASPGGGHILSNSNSLHWQIPTKNAIAMLEEAKRYGRYPLKLREN